MGYKQWRIRLCLFAAPPGGIPLGILPFNSNDLFPSGRVRSVRVLQPIHLVFYVDLFVLLTVILIDININTLHVA